MTAGPNGSPSPRTRFDPGRPGRRRFRRGLGLGIRIRTLVVVSLALGLFLAYETTFGPWRRHQDRADSYARHARSLNELAARERRLAARPGPQADRHGRIALYFTRLAANSAAMERAYRRLSWLPWSPYPAAPSAPDPPAPAPPPSL